MSLRVRRRVVAALGVATGVAWALRVERAHGEDAPVPAALQVKLLVKVAGYDKNLPARAGEKVRVLVVLKEGNADAKRIASQVIAALAEEKEIAGKSIETSSSSFSDAAALKKTIQSQKLAIVYLTPGFGSSDVEAIAEELSGVDVLTAAAVPTTVPKGIVLGFDLVSSKPKILVNLTQAKKQNVALAAEVLKLAKVYE